MTAPVVDGSVLVRSVPALSPQQLAVLRTYAETGYQPAAAERMGISYQTYKNHCSAALRALDVTTSLEAFRVLGWLDPSARHSESAAVYLADIEARLAAIHADSGALLAELRSAA